MTAITEAVAPGDLIRAFPLKSLQDSVNSVLAQIPPDKHVAVIAYANTGGAKLGVFARMPAGFSFMGTLDKPWSGQLRAEAVLAWTR